MRRTTWGLAVAALLCAGLPARAQNEDAKKYFNAAVTLYENLEYEKALTQIEKARSKASSSDDEVRITLLEGCVLADMGKASKATEAFKLGFGLDSDAKLPVAVSPKVQALAESARESVKKMLAPTLEQQRLADAKRKAEAELREKDDALKRKEAALQEEQRRALERQALATPPPAVKDQAKPGSSLRGLALIPGILGLGSAAAAVAFFAVAGGNYQALTSGSAAAADAARLRDDGKTFATLGYVFTGVAVAGVGTALAMFLLGGSSASASAPAAALVPVPGGALASFTFALPGGSR